jgi:hypothetical protein
MVTGKMLFNLFSDDFLYCGFLGCIPENIIRITTETTVTNIDLLEAKLEEIVNDEMT